MQEQLAAEKQKMRPADIMGFSSFFKYLACLKRGGTAAAPLLDKS
jgi:hypothetical protein